MSSSHQSSQFNFGSRQRIEVTTVEGASFSGVYERQNKNFIEMSSVKNLNTRSEFKLKLISKRDIVEIDLISEIEEDEDRDKVECYLRPQKMSHMKKIIENCILVNCYDSTYLEAMADISNRTVIGVTIEKSTSGE